MKQNRNGWHKKKRMRYTGGVRMKVYRTPLYL